MISTFYSVKEIVKGKFGSIISSFFQDDEEEPFQLIKINLNKTFIIHGEKDELVTKENAKKLKENCSSDCYVEIVEDMGHEIESTFHDLIYPLIKFFGRCVSIGSDGDDDFKGLLKERGGKGD